MNCGDCEITIKTKDGECFTYTAIGAVIRKDQEYAEVINSSGEIKKLAAGETVKLEAVLRDEPCDI